jgi:hypothetical protein
MHLTLARTALTLMLAAVLADSDPESKRRLIAHFEPPRSIGTPIDDIARNYTGVGLADRIAGRIRLDTDGSLTERARQLVRRHLALGLGA